MGHVLLPVPSFVPVASSLGRPAKVGALLVKRRDFLKVQGERDIDVERHLVRARGHGSGSRCRVTGSPRLVSSPAQSPRCLGSLASPVSSSPVVSSPVATAGGRTQIGSSTPRSTFCFGSQGGACRTAAAVGETVGETIDQQIDDGGLSAVA